MLRCARLQIINTGVARVAPLVSTTAPLAESMCDFGNGSVYKANQPPAPIESNPPSQIRPAKGFARSLCSEWWAVLGSIPALMGGHRPSARVPTAAV